MTEPSMLKYALITPAWNEAAHLPALIESVVRQTIQPVRWVIVSDGSTDRTDEIVRAAAQQHPWIELLRRERDTTRHFAGKAHAVNAAYRSLAALEFDLIGNLDADITLPSDYYEFLIARFIAIPTLGVAGTPFVEDADKPEAHSYAHGFADLNHVSGACQFFRRTCFDDIGGYVPMKRGGIDWVAVTTARMRGWTTRTFVEKACLHHRTMGTADRSLWRARFNHGQKDYLVGAHPLWQIVRSLFQMRNTPVIVGGLALLAGYLTAWALRKTSPVPAELRAFHRREQMERLHRLVTRSAATPDAAAAGLNRQPLIRNQTP
jgi:biofilm PGA synthesis N-glycosyltransferase PgaC